jgi:AraC-like DNA-binding protein
MGLIFLITNIYIIITALIYTGNIIDYPYLFRVFAPLYYLPAPLLFFYFRGAIYHTKIIWKKDWFHFLPAIIQFLDLIPFYLKSNEEKREILERILLDSRLLNLEGAGLLGAEIHIILRTVLLFAYIGFMMFRLHMDRVHIYKEFKGKKIASLMLLIFFIFALGGINSLISLTGSFIRNPNLDPFSNFPVLFIPLIIYLLGIVFLQGYIFFIPDNSFKPPEPSKSNKFLTPRNNLLQKIPSDTENSKLSSADGLIDKLEQGMKVEKWFLISGLNLEDCARKLECKKHILSKVINSHYKMRFNDFVNFHRVEFIKDEIRNGALKKFSLEGLAGEAGFNSRITFYNVFIKFEGLSPQEYIRKNQQSADNTEPV